MGTPNTTTNGATYKGRTLAEMDEIIRDGWVRQLTAEEMADELGIALGFIGQRVVELELPVRDHHRNIIEGTVAAHMPDLQPPADEKGE